MMVLHRLVVTVWSIYRAVVAMTCCNSHACYLGNGLVILLSLASFAVFTIFWVPWEVKSLTLVGIEAV